MCCMAHLVSKNGNLQPVFMVTVQVDRQCVKQASPMRTILLPQRSNTGFIEIRTHFGKLPPRMGGRGSMGLH